MTIREEKASLRRVMRERLLSFGVDERQVGSEALAANVAASDAYRTCTAVLAFVSLPSEPDLRLLLDRAITEGKRVGLPVCRSDGTLRFHEVGPAWQEHMMKNRWGIAEPDPVSCPPVQLDGQGNSLVLVPGLAFSPRCGRLGRGKGFYDRFLAGKPAGMISIGVCFDFQIVADLPTEIHDVKLDAVITPSVRY
ncbi:MAG: 5-formyltetrahydrofolate cyclo-ligase [Sphaerochaetaceae bacterium]